MRLDRSHARRDGGALVVPARIARIGVQDYGDHEELRTPAEVFDPESMASFEGVAVTDGHRAWVDADNFSALAVGYARAVRRDGDYLAAELVILDAGIAERILSGELTEISCGYSCDNEVVPEVEPLVQRNIRANHVALGPSGWARCGSACAVA